MEISLSSSETQQLLDELDDMDGVIGLSIFRGASLKPKGDVITLKVLNHTTDEVMCAVERAKERGAQVSVATAEIASLSDPDESDEIEMDVDEASWEEMITGLRHQSHITMNYIALMFLGGAVACLGLVDNPVPQAVAFISSAMICPGFEPLAKIPLGLVLRQPTLIKRGLLSALYGYVALIVGAALMFGVLRWLNLSSLELLARSHEVISLESPKMPAITYSVLGGVAGMIMLAAYRRNVIAGPLLLLSVIPAAALVGAAAACGSWAHMKQGFERLFIDVGVIWVTGAVVLGVKQWFVHRRRPFA